MKYLFLTLLLVGCSSAPKLQETGLYATGDCKMDYEVYEYMDKAGELPSGEVLYNLRYVGQGHTKVKCPK